MTQRLTVVLDVGKTMAKLSLWTPEGTLIAKETRANARIDARQYVALDVNGIEQWLADTLTSFAALGRIGAIIPVGHGAAAAIIRDDRLACLPMDYETPVSGTMRAAYDAVRSCFTETGSPALPDGLNLGVQLYQLEALFPGLLAPGALIVPWPQYWAWRLSGIAASEISSLGCHTDLWDPALGKPSRMASDLGWADRLAPLRKAADILGTLSGEWVKQCGLPKDVSIYCGVHDSNAAMLAARGFAEIKGREATILSTGTWFVAMRTPASGVAVSAAALSGSRDCLINVDADGRSIPSSRFMGGREIEILTGLDTRRVDIKPDQRALLDAVPGVVASSERVLPTFAPGFGPFPSHRGQWIDMPHDQAARRAAVCLYAALVADCALDLIGSRDTILIEGRFAEAKVFTGALASLRPGDTIYQSNAHNDVSYGALRLINPSLAPPSELVRVPPLDVDIWPYAQRWQRDVKRVDLAA